VLCFGRASVINRHYTKCTLSVSVSQTLHFPREKHTWSNRSRLSRWSLHKALGIII